MATEFFDDKLLSIGYATFGVLETRNLTLDDFVFLEALTNIGAYKLHKIIVLIVFIMKVFLCISHLN